MHIYPKISKKLICDPEFSIWTSFHRLNEASYRIFAQQRRVWFSVFPIFSKKNSMLSRFIDSALLREWTVHSLIVDQNPLALVSGKLVLPKKDFQKRKKNSRIRTWTFEYCSLILNLLGHHFCFNEITILDGSQWWMLNDLRISLEATVSILYR